MVAYALRFCVDGVQVGCHQDHQPDCSTKETVAWLGSFELQVLSNKETEQIVERNIYIYILNCIPCFFQNQVRVAETIAILCLVPCFSRFLSFFVARKFH